ncbi:hypothetical protein ACHAQA_007550 [Verticillium albo-atrum]
MWQHLFTAGAGLLCLAGHVSARAGAAEASPLNPCPIRCSVAGQSPLKWSYLHGIESLNRCNEPMLFSMMLDSRVDDPHKHTTIRACTASEEVQKVEDISNASPFAFGKPEKRALDGKKATTCPSDMRKASNETTLYYHEWLADDGTKLAGNIEDTVTTFTKLEDYIKNLADDCKPRSIFAKTRNTIAGVFAGSSVSKQSAGPVVTRLSNFIKDREDYEFGRVAVQNCYGQRPAAWGVGVVADLQGNITAVQESLAGWRDAECVESPDMNTAWIETELEIWTIKASPSSNSTLPSGNSTLARRADTCRAEQVGSGDDCWTMAQRCGITLANFYKFNPAKGLCDPLMDKIWVCCNEGEVPDFRPKPDDAGNCHAYNVEDDDGCWDIADRHHLKVKDIENFNNNTWGWAGCGDLQAGQKICLSKGEPPMPNPIENAICGPQKPNGEARGKKELKDMNPCLLNVCCNVWGQCGMDGDFCVEVPADTGAPGTSQPGANGCISNCGMNITNNKEGPSSFSHIAYFESWNHERDCLHMDVTDIDTEKYTHIHFSFPDITPGTFKIDVSKWQKQFDAMKKMTGIKRIVSLGGWANSAELPNYYIMREAVMAHNRATFVANIVSFVNEHGLDGIDIDWEYPGAENLGYGVPPGAADEGDNYLETLKMLKRRMGSKSVSIAAPASYWYLRGFPIKDIGAVVDYIVYMTYDLHGQWDYGNKWGSHGCDGGNCLRSHINMTETYTTLAMITKAGVPSKKVFVGIASYGRSFKMEKAGCTGPNCFYTGDRNISNAAPGMCTDTAGYIASAEIREILWNKEVLGAREWHDKESDSDIIVYRDTEWVAWMNDKTKASRIDYYKGLNFGGVSDWAVDLDKDYGDSGIGSGDPEESSLSGGRNCPLSKTYKDLDALAADDTVADDCKPVLALGVLEGLLDKSMQMYEDVDNGYDKNFAAYRRVMKAQTEAAFFKFSQWRTGGYTKWFDCDAKDYDDRSRDWKGKCEDMGDHIGAWLKGVLSIEVTLRDENGFYNTLEEEFGVMPEHIEYGTYEENNKPGSPCLPENGGQPVGPGGICTPITHILKVSGIPQLKSNFEIPNPKDIIKEVSGNLEEIRDGMAARFFDIVSGIWDGGNGDVLQVYSIPVFLLSQAVESMDEAKKTGGEILQQEKENLIINILSALLFFIPFVGQFAAMAVGAATVARMIAMAGLTANAAFSIADIVDDPANAAMAIMGLLSAGRVRKPRDFISLGTARRAQTKAGVSKMGATFKKHDDSLQKVLGNCRKDGGKDDDEPNMCKNKRDVDDGYHQLVAREPHEIYKRSEYAFFGHPVVFKRQNGKLRNCGTEMDSTTTTSTGITYTTPAMTCSAKNSQACYHYSSVMSVHAATESMVRWTCWATDSTSAHGKATDDWGYWNTQQAAFPVRNPPQHHWDWGYEWTEWDDGGNKMRGCQMDEWPPRYFWASTTDALGAKSKKRGQRIRLLPQPQNKGGGDIWARFCAKEDGFRKKGGGITKIKENYVKTTSKTVSITISGGTTTFITKVGVEVPNAVFEIKHWEQPPTYDDGLWENPCWPEMLLPLDPGWALLTNDEWYAKNPGARHSTHLYNQPPPQAVTQGKTKWKTFAGRALVGARDEVWDGEDFDEEVTPVTMGGEIVEDVVFVDEDGNEVVGFVEVVAEGMAMAKPPALTQPATSEAVASEVPASESEGLVDGSGKVAVPGSSALDGSAKPTQ